jgi:hypothetical protein
MNPHVTFPDQVFVRKDRLVEGKAPGRKCHDGTQRESLDSGAHFPYWRRFTPHRDRWGGPFYPRCTAPSIF